MQTIKDILLYCKSTFAVGTSPITKLISMQLVRDVVQYEETDDTMKLVEQILLKKIVEVCSNQRRPSLADLSKRYGLSRRGTEAECRLVRQNLPGSHKYLVDVRQEQKPEILGS